MKETGQTLVKVGHRPCMISDTSIMNCDEVDNGKYEA